MNKNLILITKPAIKLIEDESYRWKNLELEGGASLVGFFINGAAVILYAIRTGQNAVQDGCGLITDNNYQSIMIRAILAQYPDALADLMFLGDYHLHPMYLPKMSSTDKNTGKQILLDPDHSALEKLTIIITTFTNQGIIEYCPFYGIRQSNGIRFERAEIQVIEETDSIITTMLGKNYVYPENIYETRENESLYESVFTSHFTESEYGIERLHTELAEVNKVFDVKAILKHANEVFCELQIEDIKINVFFPREFPLNPPTIMFSQDENEMKEFKSDHSWNSLCSVADLLDELINNQTFPG